MTSCPERAQKIRELNRLTGVSYRLCFSFLANAGWNVQSAVNLIRDDFRRKNPWSI